MLFFLSDAATVEANSAENTASLKDTTALKHGEQKRQEIKLR